MSQLLPPGPENWIPLVALLWLASVVFLVLSTRRYLASRAIDRREAESTAMHSRIRVLASPPPVFGGGAIPDAGYSDPVVAAPVDAALPVASSDLAIDATSTNETRAAADAATNASGSDATSVREAVRARVARDSASAQGLSDLIRALYLDQSNFTFHTIAELETEDRALAKALIEAWLKEPSAVDAWEEIYDTVRKSAPSSVG